MAGAILLGTLGGAVSAAATVSGAVPTLFKFKRGLSIQTHLSIEFALGMMLAASAFSLILPASHQAMAIGHGALLGVILWILIGALFISVVGRAGAHLRPDASNKGPWLFVVAMMLHNLPEGLASGAALAGLDLKQGLPILGAIALQNIPEGLATAIAFQALGASRVKAFWGAVLTAAVELVGGTIGGVLLTALHDILPLLLAFAGGAMIWVALKETRERLSAAVGSAKIRLARDLSLGAFFMWAMAQIGS